jgi:hypothetical protein
VFGHSRFLGGSSEGILQGLKPAYLCGGVRPKAKALGYLEAKEEADSFAALRNDKQRKQATAKCGDSSLREE